MNTYDLFVSVISQKNFKLEEMIAKIERSWIKGDITESERDELLALASSNINPEAERPDWPTVCARLEERLAKVESYVDELRGTKPEPSEYEQWKPWDGNPENKNYQYGAVVVHNNAIWESRTTVQNVWEPGAPGVGDNIWFKLQDLI